MKIRWTLLLCLLSFGPVAQAQEASTTLGGMKVTTSPHSVEETQARLEQALQENDFTILATVDHAANAANVDMELPPTVLVIFGKPAVGTRLMQAAPTVALDLPQKMLIWKAEGGQVHVAYNDPAYLAERHDLDADETLANVADALEGLAESATAP